MPSLIPKSKLEQELESYLEIYQDGLPLAQRLEVSQAFLSGILLASLRFIKLADHDEAEAEAKGRDLMEWPDLALNLIDGIFAQKKLAGIPPPPPPTPFPNN